MSESEKWKWHLRENRNDGVIKHEIGEEIFPLRRGVSLLHAAAFSAHNHHEPLGGWPHLTESNELLIAGGELSLRRQWSGMLSQQSPLTQATARERCCVIDAARHHILHALGKQIAADGMTHRGSAGRLPSHEIGSM